MSGMYVMHHAFRRGLEQFERAVRGTPLDDGEAWRALAGRWQRFGMVLHHHHTVEDTSIWPPLLARCGSAGVGAARATPEAMQAEHETIDRLRGHGPGPAAHGQSAPRKASVTATAALLDCPLSTSTANATSPAGPPSW